MAARCYSVDTSALLDGWVRHYPPDHFPRLWDQVEQLASAGRFLLSEEVFEEIKVHDDTLKDWVVQRRDRLVVPTDSTVASAVNQLLQKYPRLVMSGAGRNRADPFVIAVARLCNATVLTGEKGGTPHRPKIPNVCDAEGIPHIGLLDLIRYEHWIF